MVKSESMLDILTYEFNCVHATFNSCWISIHAFPILIIIPMDILLDKSLPARILNLDPLKQIYTASNLLARVLLS